ncbi:MAG TPA: hypothetical protein VNL96_10595 [Gemmatimonadaceae bacterium]|nr:hypothetical protein [Gemmatimonadaceae bacterium]
MATTRAEEVIQQLLDRTRRSQEAWINGQIDDSIFAHDTAITLMNPFGGYSRPGYRSVRSLQERAISHFESGTDASIEVVQAIVSNNIACLVTIERSMVKFKGRDTPLPWILRVTEVYQRRGAEWQRVHRHADPLIHQISIDEILSLLDPRRGDARQRSDT